MTSGFPLLCRFAVLLLLVGTIGCGSPILSITMNADGTRLNTCGSSESHAVVVCVYQMQSDVNFKNASYEKFWRDDVGSLKADLLEKKQITLHPGDTKPVDVEINKATKFIGIAADFCKPDKENWRHIYSLASGSSDLVVSVRGDKLTVEMP